MLRYHYGFRFVRRFIRIFIFTFLMMLVFVGIFTSLFSKDVTVDSAGMAEPRRYVHLRSGITGIIREVLVEGGGRVEKGDLLVILVDTEIRTNLDKALRELGVAKAELAQARAELRVTETRTRNRVKEAEANLRLAEADLERTISQFELSSQAFSVEQALKKGTPAQHGTQTSSAEANLNKGRSESGLLSEAGQGGFHSRPDSVSASMDPDRFSPEGFAQIRMKRAQVEKAKAQLQSAEGELAQVDMVRAKIQAITRRIRKLEADVEFYRDRLEKTRIRSPVSGTVLTPYPRRGIGQRVLEGETVLVIGDLSDWVVKALLREEDIPKIREGQPAKVFIKALPHTEYKVFTGRVEEVPLSPLTDEKGEIAKDKAGRIFYPVTIGIEDPNVIKGNERISLWYGLGAKVKIVVKREKIWRLLYERFLRTTAR